MTYTITANPAFNSLEISFDGKPAQEVRDALKALNFRWHAVKKVWYGYSDENTVRAAIDGGKVEKIESKPGAVDKDMLKREFAKAWHDSKMIDFCTNKVAACAVLPSGEIFTVEKQHIETRFCFGESGYDYDEAASMAYHAKTSAEYFKRENMAYFKRWLDDLEDAKNENSNCRLMIYPTQYSGQSEDCNLRGFGFVKTSDVIDACGGSCYLSELPGKELTVNCRACRVATSAEIDAITEAFKTAAAAHEKKVDNYLKRYGMSKVDTWTYWRDA